PRPHARRLRVVDEADTLVAVTEPFLHERRQQPVSLVRSRVQHAEVHPRMYLAHPGDSQAQVVHVSPDLVTHPFDATRGRHCRVWSKSLPRKGLEAHRSSCRWTAQGFEFASEPPTRSR